MSRIRQMSISMCVDSVHPSGHNHTSRKCAFACPPPPKDQYAEDLSGRHSSSSFGSFSSTIAESLPPLLILNRSACDLAACHDPASQPPRADSFPLRAPRVAKTAVRTPLVRLYSRGVYVCCTWCTIFSTPFYQTKTINVVHKRTDHPSERITLYNTLFKNCYKTTTINLIQIN